MGKFVGLIFSFNSCHLALRFICLAALNAITGLENKSEPVWSPFARITSVRSDQIIHVRVSKSLANISILAIELADPWMPRLKVCDVALRYKAI